MTSYLSFFQCLADFRSARDRILAEPELPAELKQVIENDRSRHLEAHSVPILMLLEAALIRLACLGRVGHAPIEKWKSDCSDFGITDARIVDWLDYLHECHNKSTDDLIAAMKSSDRDSPLIILASILILIRRDSEPGDLLYASTCCDLDLT